MQNLPASLTDKTNLPQKALALALLAGSVYFAALGINAVAPTLLLAMENLWMMLLIGVPTLFVIGFVAMNPLFIWGLYKTIVWQITKFFIKMDPLSVMDRYVDYLVGKLTSLRGTVTVLTGKREKLDRKVDDLTENINENKKLGQSALKQGKQQQASAYGVKVQTDTSTLNMLLPLRNRLVKNLEFLNALAENWEFGIEKLRYQIEGKRAEYEIIKETHKGLKSAEDFISSDNEAARLYGESIKQLEEQVTQKIGFIEDFEKRSKGAMDSIAIEKQALKDEGLLALEGALNSNLMLPDFSTTTHLADVQYVTVGQPVAGAQKKFFNQPNR